MELDPEIAAAMGFESFGKTKNDSKKRRVDAAFTELNANTFNPSASGSNAMPLGPRRKSGDSGTPETRPEAPGAVASPAGADAASTPLDETSANQGAESAARTCPDPTAGMKASEARKFKKSKKNGDVPTGLGAFLNRGQQLPDRPTKEASSTPADSTPAATPQALEAESAQLLSTLADPNVGAATTASEAELAQLSSTAAESNVAAAATASAAEPGQPSSTPPDPIIAAAPTTSATEPGQPGANRLPAPQAAVQAGVQDQAYFKPSFIEDPWRNLLTNTA